MKKFIEYFSHNHLFANFAYILILIAGVLFWQITQKEELPEMSRDRVNISVSYPGASPSEVERLVTWPIEKELQNVDGIEDILSTSSEGSSSIEVELASDPSGRDNIVSEIRNTVLSVQLPDEILDTPTIQEFKSSKKAIIDIGIYLKDKKYLNVEDRKKLQKIAHTLENHLVAQPEINSITKRGYLKEELQIKLNPNILPYYQLSISSILSSISNANVRQPAGSLENFKEERITLDGEIIHKKELENLPVQGNFETRLLRLKDVSRIEDGFEKSRNVYKINGREGIFFSVVKNSHKGILEAVDKVKEETLKFSKRIKKTEKAEFIFFDDESKDVRNRIEIIKENGLLGFILIVSSLFIFLNLRAGFWVAAGIPFTFSFTLIVANLMGYTINNITLSGIIIVMGMVVDDAIVVSENINRLESQGISRSRAVIEGTSYVLLPITAAVLTTMAAFLPLLTFEGHLSMLIKPIPVIVSLMLLASLVESILILPAHLNSRAPRLIKIIFSFGLILLWEKRKPHLEKNMIHSGNNQQISHETRKWFSKVERFYIRSVTPFLKHGNFVIIFFLLFSIGAFLIMKSSMRFVLFPREEATEIRINAMAPEGSRKYETARLAEKLENIFLPYLEKDLNGFITYVGMKHFNTSAGENAIWIRLELKDKDKRQTSFKKLMKDWESKMNHLDGLHDVHFSRQRFGMSSGSPIEILVIDNDNEKRKLVTNALVDILKKDSRLTSIQTGESYMTPEYNLKLKRDLLKRLSIEAEEVGSMLRSVLDGIVIYRFLVGDEEKDVRLTTQKEYKRQLKQIVNAPVHNESGYLVPLNELVSIKKINTPQEIQRLNRQRITRVYADIQPTAKITPLEIADELESRVFPDLSSLSDSVNFSYDGEIRFSRESSGFFPLALAMILFLIYVILSLQFQSLSHPLIILMTIPPALASVVYIFVLHGMFQYGFFGIIGGLGLSGVVVNDAIVLIKKLNDSLLEARASGNFILDDNQLAEVTSSRLRAVLLTTITTVSGLFPTAYGIFGFDSMLSEMMIALSWGLIAGTTIILVLVPSLFKLYMHLSSNSQSNAEVL